MARIVLNCYEYKNGKVSKLVYDDLFKKYKSEIFPGATKPSDGFKEWTNYKNNIVNKAPGVKQKDDIGYIAKDVKGNILIFAVGSGKTGTLQSIFEEEVSGGSVTPEVEEKKPEKKVEEPAKEEKVEAKTEEGNSWDISDVHTPVKTHAEMILEGKKKIVGKFNEAQSKDVLKLLGEEEVENIVNESKEYDKLTVAIAQNLKKYGPVLNYTIYDKVKIAELVKDLAEQVKDPDFDSNLQGADPNEFDFNVIKR